MASSFLNNLSSTYRQSPSLRNQFATEQDYLDLFDNQKTTPAMAKAFNIDDYDTTGIKSIINTKPVIINQGGGDNDGPPTGPTTGFSTQGAPYGNARGGMHNYDDDDLGYKDAIGLALGGPFGYMTGKIAKIAFDKVKDKYKDWAKKEKERKEIELQKEIDAANEAAANRARVEAYTGRPMSDYRQSRPRSEQGFTGHGRSGMGRDPDDKMADGGRVGYRSGGFSVLGSSSMTDAVMKRIEALMDEGLDFGSAYTQVKKEAPALAHGGRVKSNNSGSLTEFVKSKLMEDDSQGLPAVQGIAIGMPSDQDGIISISRR